MAYQLLATGCPATPGTFGELWSIIDANTSEFWINCTVPANGQIEFGKFGGGADNFNFPYFEDRVTAGMTHLWPVLGDYCTVSVASGSFQYDAQPVAFVGQTASTTQNLAADDRIDILAVTPAGALIVITGTPAPVPAAPPLGANLLLGYFIVPAGATCASSSIVFTFLGYNSNGLGPGVNPGDVLTWNGGIWSSQPPNFSFPAQPINWLTDVNTTAPTTGQVLQFSAGQWVNASIGVIPVGTVLHSTLRWNGSAWVESANVRNTNASAVWLGNTVDTGFPTGTGTRMMWVNDAQAFRVGAANGVGWDSSNLGVGSAVMGINSTGTAAHSMTFGTLINQTAPSVATIAAGSGHFTSAAYSAAFGQNCTVAGVSHSLVAGDTFIVNAGTPNPANKGVFAFGGSTNITSSFPKNMFVHSFQSSGGGVLTISGGASTQGVWVFQDNTISNVINGLGNAAVFGRDVSMFGNGSLVKALFCDAVSIPVPAVRFNLLACRGLVINPPQWVGAQNVHLLGVDANMASVTTTPSANSFVFNLPDCVHVGRVKMFGMTVHSVTQHTSGTASPGTGRNPYSVPNNDKALIVASVGTTVSLPSAPADGQQQIVIRNSPMAGPAVTINGPILGAGSYTLTNPWQSVVLIYSEQNGRWYVV